MWWLIILCQTGCNTTFQTNAIWSYVENAMFKQELSNRRSYQYCMLVRKRITAKTHFENIVKILTLDISILFLNFNTTFLWKKVFHSFKICCARISSLLMPDIHTLVGGELLIVIHIRVFLTFSLKISLFIIYNFPTFKQI